MEFREALEKVCGQRLKTLHSRAIDHFDNHMVGQHCEHCYEHNSCDGSCPECMELKETRTDWLSSAVTCGADCNAKCFRTKSVIELALLRAGDSYDHNEWFKANEPIEGGKALWSICIEGLFWNAELSAIFREVTDLMGDTFLDGTEKVSLLTILHSHKPTSRYLFDAIRRAQEAVMKDQKARMELLKAEAMTVDQLRRACDR